MIAAIRGVEKLGTLLVIEFDDLSQAEAMRQKIDLATAKHNKFRITGMFRTPRSWCSCGPDPSTGKLPPLTRGKKLGWWIHEACRKPRLGDHELINLLAREDISAPDDSNYYMHRIVGVGVSILPRKNWLKHGK